MVLENELTYQNVTMNPEAAQLLESRSFSIEEICRWFRVPPFMVGHTTKQSSWASSLEGMNLQFLTHTLRPLLVNIEQEIGRCLLDSDDDVFAGSPLKDCCAPTALAVRLTIPARFRMAGCRETMFAVWKICRRLKGGHLHRSAQPDATEKSRKQQSCCSGSGPERTA